MVPGACLYLIFISKRELCLCVSVCLSAIGSHSLGDLHQIWYQASLGSQSDHCGVAEAHRHLEKEWCGCEILVIYILSVKFSKFGRQYLQNYPVNLNRIWYVGASLQDIQESRVTTPVDLFVKSGTGVMLEYTISYIYGSIASKSCRKVYQNTRKATMGTETPVCLYKRVVRV